MKRRYNQIEPKLSFPFGVERDADSDWDETREIGQEGEVRIKELNKSSSTMVDEAAIAFNMLW
jgi:hypothetical protein